MPPKRMRQKTKPPPPPDVRARAFGPWPTAPAATESRRMPGTAPSDPVRELWEDLNMPGAAKLKTALRQRGIPFKDAEVDALVKKSEARQLQE